MRKAIRLFLVIPTFVLVLILSSALMNAQAATADPQTTAQSAPPTVAEAEQFIQDAEVRLNDLTVKASRASWVQSNFITDDTEQMAADANEALIGATTELAKQATRYDNLKLPDELARKMLLLKLSAAVPAPAPTIPRNWPRWPASEPRSRPTTARASTARRRASTRRVSRHHRHRAASWPTAPIPTS